MTTSKVKKMLLTDAAIALSRSRCRPNRGLYSHLVVCVCLSLSAMRRNGNKKTNNNNSNKRREARTTRAPQPCRGYGSFRFYGGHTYL